MKFVDAEGENVVIFYESGDVTLKGELIEVDPGPITPDNDLYNWVVRSAGGTVVAVVEICNKATGAGIGDMKILGTLTSGEPVSEPENPAFVLRDADGTAVIALDAEGDRAVEETVWEE